MEVASASVRSAQHYTEHTRILKNAEHFTTKSSPRFDGAVQTPTKPLTGRSGMGGDGSMFSPPIARADWNKVLGGETSGLVSEPKPDNFYDQLKGLNALVSDYKHMDTSGDRLKNIDPVMKCSSNALCSDSTYNQCLSDHCTTGGPREGPGCDVLFCHEDRNAVKTQQTSLLLNCSKDYPRMRPCTRCGEPR